MFGQVLNGPFVKLPETSLQGPGLLTAVRRSSPILLASGSVSKAEGGKGAAINCSPDLKMTSSPPAVERAPLRSLGVHWTSPSVKLSIGIAVVPCSAFGSQSPESCLFLLEWSEVLWVGRTTLTTWTRTPFSQPRLRPGLPLPGSGQQTGASV